MVNHPNRRKKKVLAANIAHDHDYTALLDSVKQRFYYLASSANPRLFETNAEGLNKLYLDNLPLSQRQFHTCHACRRFIERFGHLVVIKPDGTQVPVMWSSVHDDELYAKPFAAMYERVRRAKVTGPFLSKLDMWGTPSTGEWTHFHVAPLPGMIFRERALTAEQVMAAQRENYKTVITALQEFKPAALDELLRLFKAETLHRSEKFIGPVEWLRKLHDRPKGREGSNVLWLAIATAPEGYCHPRASVVGPLLESIAAGATFSRLKDQFDSMTHGLRYQRPQAAPKAANIAQAEKLFEKLGLAPALERRFARLDDMQDFAWLPEDEVARKKGGVFGHLKPKGEETVQVNAPAAVMTWEKFRRTVLPDAQKIEIQVPAHGAFIALTTATNEDAPPILKWDSEEYRNPVAWYVYHGGANASSFNLTPGWNKVTAIVDLPTMWGPKPMPFVGEGSVVIIENARDIRGPSLALFPECLKNDLHEVRSVIEAHSNSAKMSGVEDASACGYDLRKGNCTCTLRVRTGNAWTSYRIDRWD